MPWVSDTTSAVRHGECRCLDDYQHDFGVPYVDWSKAIYHKYLVLNSNYKALYFSRSHGLREWAPRTGGRHLVFRHREDAWQSQLGRDGRS